MSEMDKEHEEKLLNEAFKRKRYVSFVYLGNVQSASRAMNEVETQERTSKNAAKRKRKKERQRQTAVAAKLKKQQQKTREEEETNKPEEKQKNSK